MLLCVHEVSATVVGKLKKKGEEKTSTKKTQMQKESKERVLAES